MILHRVKSSLSVCLLAPHPPFSPAPTFPQLVDLRWRERARKRSFVNRQPPPRAIDFAQPSALLSSAREPAALAVYGERRRTNYARSRDLDPGSLSKFGDGDGSFFDAWLTNVRVRTGDSAAAPSSAGQSTAPTLAFVSGDPMLKGSLGAPHLGLKQWTMGATDLAASRDHCLRESKARAKHHWKKAVEQATPPKKSAAEAAFGDLVVDAAAKAGKPNPLKFAARLQKKPL